MKRAVGLGVLLLVLMFSTGQSEQFRSKLLTGSVTGTDASSTDSLSFFGENMLMRSADATWDRLVGIVKVSRLVIAAGGSAIDSLGKRDTAIVTLKAIGLDGLRIDTLQTDTLVVVRGWGDIKYDLDRYAQTIATTHYTFDSTGTITASADADTVRYVNSNTTVVATPRFAFLLDHLVLDFHYIDSVRTTGDSVTYFAQWQFELIDEK